MNEMTDRLKKKFEAMGVEKAFVACRTIKSDEPTPKEISIRNCKICNCKIWASPTTVEMEEIATLVCDKCAQLANVGHDSRTVMSREAYKEYCKRTGDNMTVEERKISLNHVGKQIGTGPTAGDGLI